MYSRTPVQIRMNPSGLEKIDKIAADEGISRTEVIRACLSVALSEPSKIKERIKIIKEQM